MKIPKFGKRLFIAVILAISILLLVAGIANAEGNGAVCPGGNVKWETDGGYEYTDGTAFVTGNADQVTIEAAEGYIVTNVCVKIGGPGGGSLIYGDSEGTYGPYEYGISHVVVTTDKEDDPPPPPNWSVFLGIADAFCEEETPVMIVFIQNTGDPAHFVIRHENGEKVLDASFATGETKYFTTSLVGTFYIGVKYEEEYIQLGSFNLKPDLDCTPEDDPEEGWGKIEKTPITCPVCEGEGPLEVLDIGDMPVAWDYRPDSCYQIKVTRNIGTDHESSIVKNACGSRGHVVVVAPVEMNIFGDVVGYSTSQILEPNAVTMIGGKEYAVYFTNHNAYADTNDDGRANWYEKLKNNWWRGIWQYERFCCAGFPIIETTEGLAIIKLPRICFTGVQLALQEAGIVLTAEQTSQLATQYVKAPYGGIVPLP